MPSSTSTLIMLTILMLTLGSLEWVRSRIMVRISNRLDVLFSRDVYRASFRKALNSGGMKASLPPCTPPKACATLKSSTRWACSRP